ncbi:MAG: YitT family protein [Defluviitaleaceae bacterium]|nr:YitT family protein [Defluviitaleaceae bacterium]
MSTKNHKQIALQYLQIALGTTVLALGVYLFFMPHNLVVGGVSGLGIIILYYSETHLPFIIPVWLTNLAINIPLAVIALLVMGKKFLAKTIFAFSTFSFALFLLEEYINIALEIDFFLAAIIGGAICGVGVGLVYRQLATTGGSVLIAALLHKVLKHIPTSRILMALDWSVILLGFFVFGPERTMYAIIAIFVSTKAMEYVLEGLHFAKAAFIISEDSHKIASAITEQMDRGVTSLDGRGAYTGHEKNVLLCVVSKREIARLKEVVSNIDKKAFVIVADVREVLGEGFKDFDAKL